MLCCIGDEEEDRDQAKVSLNASWTTIGESFFASWEETPKEKVEMTHHTPVIVPEPELHQATT